MTNERVHQSRHSTHTAGTVGGELRGRALLVARVHIVQREHRDLGLGLGVGRVAVANCAANGAAKELKVHDE